MKLISPRIISYICATLSMDIPHRKAYIFFYHRVVVHISILNGRLVLVICLNVVIWAHHSLKKDINSLR